MLRRFRCVQIFLKQWSEFKTVELWQPSNNIGAAYVCSSAVVYTLKSSAFLLDLVNNKTSRHSIGGCLRFTGKVVMYYYCRAPAALAYLSHPLVLKNRWPFPFGNFIFVSPPHRHGLLFRELENLHDNGPNPFLGGGTKNMMRDNLMATVFKEKSKRA